MTRYSAARFAPLVIKNLPHMLVIAMLLAVGFAFAQQTGTVAPNRLGQNQDFDKVEIHTLPAQGNIHMLVGAGGNITVQVGKDGVLLVDTEFAPLSGKILAAVRKISDGPLRYIIDTHYHPDHTAGNENLRKAGSTIAGGNVAGDLGAAASEGAQIIAHINVLNRMSAPTGSQAPTPADSWPTDTFSGDEKKLWFNNEGVEIIHIANAHTDGDSIVYFRRSDVISTGDLFVTTSYPIIDVAAGGTINGYIEGLNRIIDLIVPVYGQEGGTLVIPGHGRLCDLGDVLNYREMTTIIRDRVQDMIKKGMTLEQVKAAKPTFDYDPLYGSNTFWTTDMFVEAVYKTLKNPAGEKK
jgi:cyclase